MNDIFQAMAQNWFWTVMGTVAVFAIAFSGIKGIFSSVSRERTRREIAAYIAEGSMTPEQGERLMKAKSGEDEGCC